MAGLLVPRPAVGGTQTAHTEQLPNGLYRIVLPDGFEMLTHGPDPVPSHGNALGPGDPERRPFCGVRYAHHVLYGHLQGQSNRVTSVREDIRAIVRRINALIHEEAIASGGRGADFRVVCTRGETAVSSFSSPGSGFGTVVAAARAAGFDDADTKYMIFFDDAAPESDICGQGDIAEDDRATAANAHNSGTFYGVSWQGCWGGDTPLHESGHNMGAVQPAAPFSTGRAATAEGGGYHCIDENDVMCYSPDGGTQNQGGTISRCTDALHFDCGHDTYFDAAPEPGEWLDDHWNIGTPPNRFLRFGRSQRLDFDGDRRADVGAYFAGNGSWWAARSTGTSFGGMTRWLSDSAEGNGYQVFPGDFDGDGREDAGAYFGGNGTWWVARSTGTSFGGMTRWLSDSAEGDGYEAFSGDFDGDGRDDMGAHFPGNGTWWVALSTGTSFGGMTRWLTSSMITTGYQVLIGDFDGDGRDDVGTYHPFNGNWLVARSAGSSFGPMTPWLTGQAEGDGYESFTGDFDGNGRDDIGAYFAGNGTWWVARSTGTSFGGMTRWLSDTAEGAGYQVFPGDFNGDGRDDVGAYFSGNGTWWVAPSTGTAFGGMTRWLSDSATGDGYRALGTSMSGESCLLPTPPGCL